MPTSSSASSQNASDMQTQAAWRCLGCGHEQSYSVLEDVKDVLTHKEGHFSIVQCFNCGLHSTSPVLNEQQLAYFYQGVYSNREHSVVQDWQTGVVGRLLTRYRLAMIARVHRISASSKVLDVGCGYGGFVRTAHALTGCEIHGIDNDQHSIAQAQYASTAWPRIQFMAGQADSSQYGAEQFDVICFFQSLEHMMRPIETLKHIQPWLKPGGICVIEVPNFAGLWRQVFGRWWLPLLVPQHRVHFTPRTLRQTMEAAGFQTVSQTGMFFPTESTISLVLWLNHNLGKPIRSYKLSWCRPLGWLIAAVACIWWLAVELPVQLICWPFNRTGHHMLIARKQ
jgi:2-polyprenyl-3-methyl-5-hydroxy-6-metoxy-1,4-benzoquinol methylase